MLHHNNNINNKALLACLLVCLFVLGSDLEVALADGQGL